VAALVLAGCELAPSRSAQSAAACMTGPAVEYVEYARHLSAAEPSARTRLHQEALAQYRQQPDTERKIRVALAASFLEPLPDEMTQTRALFRDLLQPGPAIAPGLAALLEMRLNEMETRLAAQKQAARQQAELDAAQAKIQALTTIEKTLDPPAGGTRGR
jgi:hypothetical protein